MMEGFKKLLMERAAKQGPVDDKKMSAKAMVMKELSDMLGDGMKNDMMDGLKKVSVASDSQEGLEKGLDLAKKKVEEMKEESPEEEASESPEMEASEDESMEEHDMPEEESAEGDDEISALEKKIAELKAKKQSKY